MLIKSQDGKRIIETRDVHCVGCLVFADYSVVAHYATEEDAIKQIAELESHINRGYQTVFEMPEE